MLRKISAGVGAFWVILGLCGSSAAVELNFPIPDYTLKPDIYGYMSLYPGTLGQNTKLSNNIVNVNAGVIPGNVYGGLSTSTQEVSGNRVGIYGGDVGAGPFAAPPSPDTPAVRIGAFGATTSVGGAVYGGLSWFGGASGNTVSIAGGSIDGNVRGGMTLSGTGAISGNQVLMSAGTVSGEIDGGLAISGVSSGNAVSISGGEVYGIVWGGSSLGGGGSVQNGVSVSGGKFHAGIFGGYALGGGVSSCYVSISGLTGADSFPAGSVEIYGGYSPDTGLVSGNSVSIDNSSGVRAGSIIGGFSVSGSGAEGNSTTVAGSPGLSAGRVVGGYATGDGAEAKDNRVAISGSAGFQVGFDITGGSTTKGGFALDNSVSIADSSGFQAGNIVGGYAFGVNSSDPSVFGPAAGNTITLSNSPNSTASAILAGYSQFGAANENTVTLSGMAGFLVDTDIVGGSSNQGDEASFNAIKISDAPGLSARNVFGGHAPSGSLAHDNSVTFANVPNFNLSGSIVGGLTSGGDFWTNNTLTMNSSYGAAEGVLNFQNYNFLLPASLGNGDTLIGITGSIPTQMGNTTLTVTGIEGGGNYLRPGDSVTLIGYATGNPAVANVTNVPKGLALLYDFKVTTAGDALRLTLDDEKRNPSTDILPAGVLVELAMLSHYAELVDGLAASRLMEPQERREPAAYARVVGGNFRYDANANLDVRGATMLAGIDWNVGGNLVLGGFFEAGLGNYDSRHFFTNLPEVKGNGDISYYGGGLLGFLSLPGNFYAEASVRAGLVRSDYRAGVNLPFIDQAVGFELSRAYYGAHLGFGHLWTDGRSSLDFHAKYFWVRQAPDELTILGDLAHFDASDSQRLRVGARYSLAVTPKWTPFVGAAFEYEFDSKVNARVHTFHISEPGLKGGSGIGEIGVAYVSDNGLTLELAIKGYMGTRVGLTGRVQLGWKF